MQARACIFYNNLAGKFGEDVSKSENDFSVLSIISNAPRQQESLKDESILAGTELA